MPVAAKRVEPGAVQRFLEAARQRDVREPASLCFAAREGMPLLLQRRQHRHLHAQPLEVIAHLYAVHQ